jgi:uncharacterized protein YutE (UPF0331/DUF86 family)
MTSEVIYRKKELLIKYIEDLKTYENYSYEEFLKDHYSVERILELLVAVSSDIVFHLISQKEEEMPTTYRTAFLRAGELDLISNDLALKLAEAAGMRNILIHGYEEIDFHIIYKSIKQAIHDFSWFLIEIDKIR